MEGKRLKHLGALAAAGAAAGLLARQSRRARAARFTDRETGLFNRQGLERAAARLPGGIGRRYLVYFYLDLDHVGYLGGHEPVQKLLRHGGWVLRRQAREGELLAREGGGLIALKRAGSPQEAARWAEGVLEQLRQFPLAGGRLRPRDTAAGICRLEGGRRGLAPTLFHARQCALTARREGRALRICGTASCQACQERWQLAAEFRQGLARGEFQLCLQFFVDARTFQIVGGEALSRWNHPSRGLLSPDRYVPLLEREGGIQEVDFHGLEETCAFLEELDRQGETAFFISCNFSRRTFSDPGFVRRCAQVLGRYRFSRRQLVLEVTESQWIGPQEGAQMLQNIREMRAMGVRVVFDDFGMGFSSFHDLQEYPMDGLKLDKQLVDNMWTAQGRVLLAALVRTGHELGLTILAEGVEEERQLEVLRQLGCDMLQGFHFSVPLPAGQAKELILQRGRGND